MNSTPALALFTSSTSAIGTSGAGARAAATTGTAAKAAAASILRIIESSPGPARVPSQMCNIPAGECIVAQAGQAPKKKLAVAWPSARLTWRDGHRVMCPPCHDACASGQPLAFAGRRAVAMKPAKGASDETANASGRGCRDLRRGNAGGAGVGAGLLRRDRVLDGFRQGRLGQ